MKKIIVLVVTLLLIALGIVYFSTDVFRPANALNELETSKLSNESYLDILVNIKKFSKEKIDNEKILEAAMRIARELELVKFAESPVYVEYVPRETVHKIIEELTGVKLESPIEPEDFYYMYDKENDYYYIVPIGTDWIHIGSLKNATKKGNTYEINCTAEETDYNGTVLATYENVKISLKKKPNQKYVKYQLISIDSTEPIVVEQYEPIDVTQYGTSEEGRALLCHSFTPEEYERTILLNFAIHGFEDNYDKDGQVLVDTANKLIEYYSENEEAYRNTRIFIVSCANPDGLEDGTTNNGFGRCNANGVDLNRDFDAEHKVFTNARNKTLEPFSAAESRALRDLVNEIEADVVIDFHGWLNMTIGDASLAEIFEEEMSLKNKTAFNNRCNGYFSYWAHLNGAEALLVEFKDEKIPFEKLVSALDKII